MTRAPFAGLDGYADNSEDMEYIEKFRFIHTCPRRVWCFLPSGLKGRHRTKFYGEYIDAVPLFGPHHIAGLSVGVESVYPVRLELALVAHGVLMRKNTRDEYVSAIHHGVSVPFV